MFRLNLKIALRNLWKDKVYTLISMTGMGVALCIFIFAMLYANYEKSYDSWNKDYQQIYRVNYRGADEDVALSPGNMATLSKERIPAVEASTRVQDYWWGNLLLKIKTKNLYLKDVLVADSNFFKVFSYPLVYGNASKALASPYSLVISKQLSETIFGKGINPVGETVILDKTQGYVIDAVIDVARYPSHFHFNLIRRFKKSASDDYYTNNYYTYLKISPQADPGQVESQVNRNRKEVLSAELLKLPPAEKADFEEYIKSVRHYLQPIGDIHLKKSNVEYEFRHNGIGVYIYLMLTLAVLVLVIAAVNFTNLSITMASKRAKETGIRKVLGAHRIQIAVQFILETAFQCLLSLVLAMVLVELFLPSFNVLINRQIQLEQISDYAAVALQVFLVLAGIIFVMGLYPALMISNLLPARVLKGNFSSSNQGAWIRNGLIVLQFFIAVLFISGILVINRQLHFMEQKDLGYKPEQVLAITMMQENNDAHFRTIKNTLKAIPGVNSISRTDHLPGESMGGNSYMSNGKVYNSSFMTVDVDYFQTMGMKLMAGRTFDASNRGDTLKSLVLTESAAKAFGLQDPVGKTLKYHGIDVNVIGLIKDFNHYSPEKGFQPIVFQYMRGNTPRYVLVNLSSRDAAKTIEGVEQAWQKLEPDFPIKYTLLDKTFAGLLEKQVQLSRIISLLSVITILLALMGIFAIASFSTQRRKKEINIRKVLGASVMDILGLLNKGFVKLVILANLIAWPVAYFILRNWLDDFAFRIEMPLLPFFCAGGFTLLLTVLIVSLQSYQAASVNPVDALKYE